jgi:hypothetical protein
VRKLVAGGRGGGVLLVKGTSRVTRSDKLPEGV